MQAGTEAPSSRTRRAPSPTGSLHVGGARTALFSWLKAKKEGGKFIIRVEDTDTARSTRESENEVLADLEWLGLKWDEGPVVGGDKGPYRQSERMVEGRYQELAQTLMENGHAYPCFCTQAELDQKKAAAELAGENPQYDGTWRDADPEEVKKKMDAGEPYTVRFKVPRGKVVTIQDSVRGEVSWDVAAPVGDFILLRSGGMPVYNFCVAVDDALMQVSDVIRAEEHLTNTVRQVLILEALGYTMPKYAHLALVLGEDRSKLSKRHGATSVNQFRLEGFLPEAMINYLCLLGWNDNTDKEIYTVEELTEAFSLDRVTKSPAVFDMKKLRWINGQHLRALPKERLCELIGAQLLESKALTGPAPAFTMVAADMVAEKVELVNDAEALIRDALLYPLDATVASEAAAPFIADGSFPAVGRALVAAHKAGELPPLDADDFAAQWKAWVTATGKALNRKGKGLFMPLRIATTGRMAGPDIPAQLNLLGLKSDAVDLAAATMDERMAVLEHALKAFPEVDEAPAEEAAAEAAPAAAAAAPAPPSGPVSAMAGNEPFEMLDVRIGKIVDAWPHPESDKLWCEKIDVGEAEPREIASGLRAYYSSADELIDRKVLVVCNLKPAKMAGFASNGMVLCASSEDKSKVAFVEPPEGAEPGMRVLMEGQDAVEPASGNAVKKKKLLEKAAEELKAVDAVATAHGKPLVVAGEKCATPLVPSGTIS